MNTSARMLLVWLFPGLLLAEGPLLPSAGEVIRELPHDIKKAAKQRQEDKPWIPFRKGSSRGAARVIQSGFDLNLKDHAGNTPLCLAADFAHGKIVRMLLDTGRIRVNEICAAGNSALLLAARSRNAAIIKMLLEHRAQPEIVNANGETLLHLVHTDVATLEYLRDKIKFPSIVNTRDRAGKTPLHWAVLAAKEQSVEMFLKEGADPNIPDSASSAKGFPLHTAVDFEQTGIVALLLKGGARTDVKDAYGQTPMDIALRKNNPALIQLLRDR